MQVDFLQLILELFFLQPFYDLSTIPTAFVGNSTTKVDKGTQDPSGT